MRNWSSNAWVLAILSVVLLIVTVDYARQLVPKVSASAPQASPEETSNPGNLPKFKVGDLAPDFSLLDAKQKPQTLSKLVKRDTVLCFLCGCSNCRQYQTYLAEINKRLKDKAPDVISVTSTAPEAEQAYRRDVPLKQTMLYEQRGGKVMQEYQGHPCPRAYRLNADRTVKWISSSMSVIPLAQEIAYETARELGFATAETKDTRLPKAPLWDLVVNAPKLPVQQAKRSEAKPESTLTGGGSLPPYLATPKIGN